jgi:hypothetical protein
MNEPLVVWGVDWALSTGVAVAWRHHGEIRTVRIPTTGSTDRAPRLASFHMATGTAAEIAAASGLPTAVYYEQAFGNNLQMHEAAGTLQAALFIALDGRTPHPPNVWPILASDWRRSLGLTPPPGRTKHQRRKQRKEQQQRYALQIGAPAGLSEDEYDAACILRAGELDIGTGEAAA